MYSFKMYSFRDHKDFAIKMPFPFYDSVLDNSDCFI